MALLRLKAENRPLPSMHSDYGQLRRLPFDGTENFRDLGGYKNINGKFVRRGLIFRSGQLSKLSKADRRYLNRLGIVQVVDFRSGFERNRKPDKLPADISYIHSPIGVAGEDVKAQMMDFLKGKADIDLAVFMKNINYKLVNQFSNVYSGWLADIVKTEEALPQVFHCTAGKDRTGFAAAVLLRILGVSEEIVMEDYLLTNIYNKRVSRKVMKAMRLRSGLKRKLAELRPLFAADRAYLQTAFSTIDDKYGSFNNYCAAADGLSLSEDDIGKLRDIFLKK